MIGSLIFYSLNYDSKNKNAIPIFYNISSVLGIYMLFSFCIVIYSVK